MSKSTYKMIDLLIFTFLACVLDAINVTVFKRFPVEGFTLTLHVTLALIALIRWGLAGAFVALVGGVSYCLFAGNLDIYSILAYSIGNAFVVFNVLWFRYLKKKDIIFNTTLLTFYVITGYLLVSFGRGLTAMIITGNFNEIYMRNYLLFELFNMFAAVIIIYIGKKQDGFVEDMNDYLIRINQDRLDSQRYALPVKESVKDGSEQDY